MQVVTKLVQHFPSLTVLDRQRNLRRPSRVFYVAGSQLFEVNGVYPAYVTHISITIIYLATEFMVVRGERVCPNQESVENVAHCLHNDVTSFARLLLTVHLTRPS